MTLGCSFGRLSTVKPPSSRRRWTESLDTLEDAIVVIFLLLAHVQKSFSQQPQCTCAVALFSLLHVKEFRTFSKSSTLGAVFTDSNHHCHVTAWKCSIFSWNGCHAVGSGQVCITLPRSRDRQGAEGSTKIVLKSCVAQHVCLFSSRSYSFTWNFQKTSERS